MPKCDLCGKRFRGFGVSYYEYGSNRKVRLCKECAEGLETFICPSCGFRRRVDGREFHHEERGFTVCGDCIDRYGICEVCGIPGGPKIEGLGCIYCTVICDGCGERIPRGSQLEIGGYYLCPECAGRYTVCNRCGDLIEIDKGCPRCSLERRLEEKLDKAIEKTESAILRLRKEV